MDDRWGRLRRATTDAALRAPGRTTVELRQGLARGEAPPELQALVDLVRREPAAVSDEDVSALKGRYDEDQLFEIVVATALGVAGEKLDAALAALEEAAGP
jgi:alkylhydroperoxidase family enzyme